MLQTRSQLLSLLCFTLIVVGCATPTSTPLPTITVNPRPAWHSVPFTNIGSGQAVALTDFAERFVIVAITADWCAACLVQERQLTEALSQLEAENALLLVLHIDPSDNVEALRASAGQLPPNIVVGMSNSILDSGLIEQFGKQVNNPPNMPMFFIRPDGSMSPLYTGTYATSDVVGLVRGQAALR